MIGEDKDKSDLMHNLNIFSSASSRSVSFFPIKKSICPVLYSVAMFGGFHNF